MEYFQIEFENETAEETMKYIESKRNWVVADQCYKIPPEVEEIIELITNLSKCKIYWRGQYLIVEHNDMVHYWDSFPHCYLKQAVEFMDLENPAEWKTIAKLISLRMGIRQTEVNMCGYVDAILQGEKMTLKLYNNFMRVARLQDFIHHGSHTF
jgi:hypothetical protein